MKTNTDKLLLTLLSAAVCTASTILTRGETGIGWFILSLTLIW